MCLAECREVGLAGQGSNNSTRASDSRASKNFDSSSEKKISHVCKYFCDAG